MKQATRLFTVLTALGATACVAPRMVPPPEVATKSRVIDATGRGGAGEAFKLGKYSITDVDRDWAAKKVSAIGPYEKAATASGYTYKFKSVGQTLNGMCGFLGKDEGRRQVAVDFDLGKPAELVCQCGEDIVVEVRTGADAGGKLSLGETEFEMAAETKTDRAFHSQGPVGYRVDSGNTPIAAVELLLPGRIWMNRDVSSDDARQMACVFAGLMLHAPPSEY